MYLEEYPHRVIVQSIAFISDKSVYPPVNKRTISEEEIEAFMDTPSTSEQLTYHQRDIKLTRFMYYPYDSVILNKTDLIVFEGTTYEIVGSPENQGGQNEVYRVPLNERIS